MSMLPQSPSVAPSPSSDIMKTNPVQRKVDNDHEYLRFHVDPVLMPLIETLLLYQPQCIHEFIRDYTDDSKVKRFQHRKYTFPSRRSGIRDGMVEYMSSKVIPLMDDLSRQILKRRPANVREFIRSSVAARMTHEKMKTQELAYDELAIGSRIMCRYKGRPRAFPGFVERLSPDGEHFDIVYDDGRKEKNVHRLCVHKEIPSDESLLRGKDTVLSNTKMDMVLLVIGLDGAGKTTLLSTLQGDPEKEHVSSAGFSSTTFEIAGGTATFYDLGGGPAFRNVWEEYYADVHGVVFVVDTSARTLIDEATSTLNRVASDERIKQKPILIFANKQDVSSAMNENVITLKFHLDESERVKLVPCIAKPSRNKDLVDERLEQGLKWLLEVVSCDFYKIDGRVQVDRMKKKQLDFERKEAQRARVMAWREDKERIEMFRHDTHAKETILTINTRSEMDVRDFTTNKAIICWNCSIRPAVTKCAASKWMPVCDECARSLK
ncbi:hypothetical protein ABG067_002208 [Albugo candida]